MTAWTSLPNLHPAVVHFPVALIVTALAVDAAALAVRRAWLDRAATLLWCLAALTAGAAYLTGGRAASGLGVVGPEIEGAITRHADAARGTLLGVIGVAIVRLALAWVARADDRIRRPAPRGLVLVASVALTAWTAVTADRGGALVYRHGVAVAAAAPSPASTGPAPPREARGPVESEGGAVWRPEAGDAAALGTSVDVVTGEEATLRAVPEAAGDGLPLRVDGAAVILLPGTFDDVQISAHVDVADFEGSLGLVHHFAGPADYGCFEVAADGSRLLVRRGEDVTVLERGPGGGDAASWDVSVSSSGHHLKGFIGGSLAAHGHREPPPAGRAGLRLEGHGLVRLRELRAERP